MSDSTLPASVFDGHAEGTDDARVPGLALVFAGGQPRAVALPLSDGALELGRADGGGGPLDDKRVSRRHARVTWDGRRFSVLDLGSQNGTFADGESVPAGGGRELQRVLRLGDTLLVPLADVRPLDQRGVRVIGDFVRGPTMQRLLEEVGSTADHGGTLHISGETGVGKEGVAQAFHAARGVGRLVAVNCAIIPHNLAERLLFGAKRGAYSGADADSAGYLQEADGGTLFLDEVAELEPAVQAKLLRAIQTREVVPLGAARGRKVDFRLCSASNRDLRALAASGQLREDVYFRIGRPEVLVPPLRQRPEEIGYLVVAELGRTSPSLAAHVSLVEQCLLRPWPGNVRELLAEVRAAARAALAARPRA
jgi:transcriptional regulator of acetoin/glycerol metabolism